MKIITGRGSIFKVAFASHKVIIFNELKQSKEKFPYLRPHINKVISTKRYQAFAQSAFEFISAGIIKILRSREAHQ
ncbi:MAG TPA: hypothetical protein DDY34_14825 [Bacteroidales bacterium]|nr:hypothetical protein [Bacteroidales bacterium]HBH85052.1 hypothetical protein [Bacteroidales bacterium]HBQ83119.1 hypothetical protein [Bacteroidales bacterium]HCU18295.1 hypothetical protein [Bacteroidales bacterium]